MRGLGLRVSSKVGSGFKIQGFKLRISDSGFGV